jgi:hypothetical protein
MSGNIYFVSYSWKSTFEIRAQNVLHMTQCTPRYVLLWTATSVQSCRWSCSINNIHNQHQWAEKNPHVLVHFRHQQQSSINVLAGIVGDYLGAPNILPLTGNHYREFLLHSLPKLLDDIPLAARTRLFWKPDDGPAHFSRAVRDALYNTPHGRWTSCMARFESSGLIVMGAPKTLVYAAPVDNERHLIAL